jgi:hypothetical protein
LIDPIENKDRAAVLFFLRHGAKTNMNNNDGDDMLEYISALMPVMRWTFFRAKCHETCTTCEGFARCHHCMDEPDNGEDDLKRCGNCRSRLYCNRECQTKDWKSHKFACAIIKERKKKEEDEEKKGEEEETGEDK